VAVLLGLERMTRLASISILLLGASLISAQTPAPNATSAPTGRASQTSKRTSKKSAQRLAKPTPATPVAVVPQPPPPPPTLAQQSPVTPRVTYQNGLLSIDAPNSTLGDILGGIRRATGATIDGPMNLNDRVIVHLGPGEPRQVMASLLGSSRFDFIVMGTPQQPNGLSRIVLMARQGGNEQQQNAGAPVNQAAQQPAQVADTDGEEEDNTPDRDDNSDGPPSQPMVAQPAPEQQNPVPQPQMPPDQTAQPQGQQNQQGQQNPQGQQGQLGQYSGQQGQQDQGQNPQAAPNSPKTPEQLYKELQNLERQRQQQQQQQPQNQNQDQQPPPQ
jgi:hypothetical protein